jgi:hypothetical protein
MAEVVKTYHETTQAADILQHTDEERRAARERSLAPIPAHQQLDAHPEHMNKVLNENQVLEALMSSKSGSAAGIDGIPYNIWKLLHQKHNEALKNNKPSFDLIKTLTHVLNDIQLHGMTTGSPFTTGWMCPLYKKKDRSKIENYCPITLLNTDYKIFTKALAIQVAKVIHRMIHPHQSGFIPKRSIFDPIRLVQTMTTYADLMEEDGAIIVLDQEKAYDKIQHTYLFETLEAFHLPPLFVNTVKNLYKSAYTQVAINGFLSSPFQVTRGVHQGDPLSCLLFDLAIEPLACAI